MFDDLTFIGEVLLEDILRRSLVLGSVKISPKQFLVGLWNQLDKL